MLQDRIRYLQDGTLPDPGLNMDRLYATLQKYGIRYPKIVLAQAILETGYFTSRVCLDKNNLFGLRRPCLRNVKYLRIYSKMFVVVNIFIYICAVQ